MKFLSNYTQAAQTKMFKEQGVFFAFSKKQIDEGCKQVGALEDCPGITAEKILAVFKGVRNV